MKYSINKHLLMSKTDCEGMCQLLQHGFTLLETLKLLENKRNQLCFLEIQNKLEIGMPIEQFFGRYCPLIYQEYFDSFICFLPFTESLKLCVKLSNEEIKQRNELFKSLCYPILMFLGTIFGVYFFIIFCFPTLISLMKDFSVKSNIMELVVTILFVVIQCVMFLLLVCLIIIMYFIQKKNQVKGYKLLTRYIHFPLIKQIQSNQFARYFYQCTKIGCKTKQALQILKTMKNRPILVFLSCHLDESLLKGEKMEKALQSPYLDETLYHFMNIAIYSSSMESMLEGYIEVNHDKLRILIKQITKIVQVCTYSTIGLIIIFVYQILMIPLSVMSQM